MRSIIFAIVLIFNTIGLSATTIAEIFTSKSNPLFPSLEENDRLDMIDYYQAGQTRDMTSGEIGTSAISSMTDDYIAVKVSNCMTIEIRQLQCGSDTILLVAKTLKTPAKDSTLEIYDSLWNKLDSNKYIGLPRIEDFIKPGANKKQILKEIEFPLVEISIAEKDKIIFTQTLEDYMSQEAYKAISSMLVKSITYTWNGKKFAIAK